MNPKQNLKNHALNFLSRREHSKLELSQKLQRHSQDESLITDVIEELAQENLQSDHRFAESYTHSKSQRGYGPMYIKHALKQRGIASDIIDAMLYDDIDWQKLASLTYVKKYGEKPAKDYQEKSKRMRFLQQRGFSKDFFPDM